MAPCGCRLSRALRINGSSSKETQSWDTQEPQQAELELLLRTSEVIWDTMGEAAVVTCVGMA